LRVTISKGSRAHHAFMTTVIVAIRLGLEPIVYLVGGVYAAMAYGESRPKSAGTFRVPDG
jgi:hypothetical protein